MYFSDKDDNLIIRFKYLNSLIENKNVRYINLALYHFHFTILQCVFVNRDRDGNSLGISNSLNSCKTPLLRWTTKTLMMYINISIYLDVLISLVLLHNDLYIEFMYVL